MTVTPVMAWKAASGATAPIAVLQIIYFSCKLYGQGEEQYLSYFSFEEGYRMPELDEYF